MKTEALPLVEWCIQALPLQGGLSGLALDFVDFDLTTSIMCQILLGQLQLQIWQNWHSIPTAWWNSQVKVNNS